MSSIEDQGQTDRVSTFSFNHLRVMVVNHTRVKDQGQRSVGSKDRVETDGQTDGGDCITSSANAVGTSCYRNSDSPHRRRAWIVQLYSPGGAHMCPSNACLFL